MKSGKRSNYMEQGQFLLQFYCSNLDMEQIMNELSCSFDNYFFYSLQDQLRRALDNMLDCGGLICKSKYKLMLINHYRRILCNISQNFLFSCVVFLSKPINFINKLSALEKLWQWRGNWWLKEDEKAWSELGKHNVVFGFS